MEIESTLTRQTYLSYLLTSAVRSVSFIFYGTVFIAFLAWGIIEKSLILITYPVILLAATILTYGIWMLSQFFWSKNSKFFFMKRHFTFCDEDIVFKVSTLEYIYKWEAFKEWKEIANCYVLSFPNGKKVIIPIADVPAEEIQAFENLLRQKIEKLIVTKRTMEN